jgi:hypothetical protein
VTLEAPPGFGVRTEAQKAAHDNGYRLDAGINGGWLSYTSTTAPGRIWIGAVAQKGPWYLSLDHAGVAAELTAHSISSPDGPGRLTVEVSSVTNLHRLLDQVYRLSMSLPYAPLERFQKETAKLPSATEVERIVKQRIGQSIFRDALLDYWNRSCPLTGITEPDLLRASHIVAWAECDDDAHRLDVHNGLLLSALWDAAFDRGLVSFADDGTPLASPNLSLAARAAMSFDGVRKLGSLRDSHCANLRRHRAKFGFEH